MLCNGASICEAPSNGRFGIVIDFPIVHGAHDIYSHIIKFLMIENQQKFNEK